MIHLTLGGFDTNPGPRPVESGDSVVTADIEVSSQSGHEGTVAVQNTVVVAGHLLAIHTVEQLEQGLGAQKAHRFPTSVGERASGVAQLLIAKADPHQVRLQVLEGLGRNIW